MVVRLVSQIAMPVDNRVSVNTARIHIYGATGWNVAVLTITAALLIWTKTLRNFEYKREYVSRARANRIELALPLVRYVLIEADQADHLE